MQRLVTHFLDTFFFRFVRVVQFELLVILCFLDELNELVLLLLHCLTYFASLLRNMLRNPLFKRRRTYAGGVGGGIAVRFWLCLGGGIAVRFWLCLGVVLLVGAALVLLALAPLVGIAVIESGRATG